MDKDHGKLISLNVQCSKTQSLNALNFQRWRKENTMNKIPQIQPVLERKSARRFSK